jgi:hypothetical protein
MPFSHDRGGWNKTAIQMDTVSDQETAGHSNVGPEQRKAKGNAEFGVSKGTDSSVRVSTFFGVP